MKINVLDNDTILKIAAGEVVERPASVVKELVDNALDAGAANIVVEVFDGGKEKIVISDDGEGMEASELLLAVERHTTSKISSGRDLFAISTMGFRGEALASIGAISVMTITTRTKASAQGSKLVVRGGEKGEVQPASSPVGTRIAVSDLFFNTPARKKFLRRSATEFSAIVEVIHQLILAWPGTRFKLVHNDKTVVASPGTGSLVDAVASLAGTDVAENLIPCSASRDGYTLSGYIAKPGFHRSNRGMQYITVNKRPVNVRLVGSAVEKAFHTLLPINRYPIAFLNLDVPAAEVDVNVHPAKREVKFTDSNTVFRLVHQACLEALTEITGQPVRPSSDWKQFPQTELPYRTHGEAQYPKTPPRPYAPPIQPIHWVREQVVQEQLVLDNVAPALEEREYTILGQVFSSFIVVSTPGELRLVDQHAAQERVLYEKYLNLLKNGERPGQVVIPVETQLSGRHYQFVQAHLTRLVELGFKLELTETGMIVKEVPILFKKMLSTHDITEIIEQLHEQEHNDFELSDYSQAALMLLACKGAIKANQKLSEREAIHLLQDLDKCENSRTCPHGRPIWVAFDRINLEKMFARR